MAKPAITTPIVDVIQVVEKTIDAGEKLSKQDIIAITDNSADNSVYTSVLPEQPNNNEANSASPATPTHSVASSDLKAVTGTISNLRGDRKSVV